MSEPSPKRPLLPLIVGLLIAMFALLIWQGNYWLQETIDVDPSVGRDMDTIDTSSYEEMRDKANEDLAAILDGLKELLQAQLVSEAEFEQEILCFMTRAQELPGPFRVQAEALIINTWNLSSLQWLIPELPTLHGVPTGE